MATAELLRRIIRHAASFLLVSAVSVLTVRLTWRSVRKVLAGYLESARRSVAQYASDLLVDICVSFTSAKGVNRLVQEVSESIVKEGLDVRAKTAMREAALEAMRFEELHSAIVETLTGSMIAASRDKSLRAALLGVITAALKDEGFVEDMLSTMTAATISAAKNRELRDSVLGIAKSAITDTMKDSGFLDDMTSALTSAGIRASQDESVQSAMVDIGKAAVTEALRDERFLQIIRDTLANSLKDGNIYRGAAMGVVGALNPWGRGRAAATSASPEVSEMHDDDVSASP